MRFSLRLSEIIIKMLSKSQFDGELPLLNPDQLHVLDKEAQERKARVRKRKLECAELKTAEQKQLKELATSFEQERQELELRQQEKLKLTTKQFRKQRRQIFHNQEAKLDRKERNLKLDDDGLVEDQIKIMHRLYLPENKTKWIAIFRSDTEFPWRHLDARLMGKHIELHCHVVSEQRPPTINVATWVSLGLAKWKIDWSKTLLLWEKFKTSIAWENRSVLPVDWTLIDNLQGQVAHELSEENWRVIDLQLEFDEYDNPKFVTGRFVCHGLWCVAWKNDE